MLIDALDAPRDWDRATVVHARSMELFDALGVADRFLAEGVMVHGVRFRSGGEVLGELDFRLAESKFPFDVGISEEVTESVLTANLEAHGGAVTRSTRLVDLRQDADGVTVALERDGERSEVATSWVVGCDGTRSVVRRLSGIAFPGTDVEAPWAVFDAATDGWDEEYDMTMPFFDRPLVILTSLPERRWRVYLRPRFDDGDLVAEATEVIKPYKPGITFTEVENPVRFHCHSRVAERFRSGRVLLAGDAAHAASPAEGHGMNTGLQDAFNLGWKLALVCRGESNPGLLDSFEAERRPVATRIVASGDDVEAAQALTAEDERAARDAAMRNTFADPESTHHEAAAHAEVDRSYADSHVVTGDAGAGLVPGDRLPSALHELAHRPGHTLLVIGGPEAAPGQVAELAAALEDAHSSSPVVDAVIGLSAETEISPIGEIGEFASERLGIEGVTVLAVRPDHYVGFRHDGRDPGAVQAYLDALTA